MVGMARLHVASVELLDGRGREDIEAELTQMFLEFDEDDVGRRTTIRVLHLFSGPEGRHDGLKALLLRRFEARRFATWQQSATWLPVAGSWARRLRSFKLAVTSAMRVWASSISACR